MREDDYRSLVVRSQLHILPCDVVLRLVKNKGNKAQSSYCVKGLAVDSRCFHMVKRYGIP